MPAVSFTRGGRRLLQGRRGVHAPGVAPSYPSRQATTGFLVSTAARSTVSATAGDDGLETMSRTRVARVAAQGRDTLKRGEPADGGVEIAPPVPIACETPLPSRWIKVVSS